MNTAPVNENRRPFARAFGAVAAFVGECNYASARLARMYSPLLAERAASK
jgi:hypothetical protein